MIRHFLREVLYILMVCTIATVVVAHIASAQSICSASIVQSSIDAAAVDNSCSVLNGKYLQPVLLADSSTSKCLQLAAGKCQRCVRQIGRASIESLNALRRVAIGGIDLPFIKAVQDELVVVAGKCPALPASGGNGGSDTPTPIPSGTPGSSIGGHDGSSGEHPTPTPTPVLSSTPVSTVQLSADQLLAQLHANCSCTQPEVGKCISDQIKLDLQGKLISSSVLNVAYQGLKNNNFCPSTGK